MRIGKVCHFPGCAGRRGPGGGHMFHVKHWCGCGVDGVGVFSGWWVIVS